MGGRTGTCYEVCWAKTPYEHAGHYLGFAYAIRHGRLDDAELADMLAAAVIIGPGGRERPAMLSQPAAAGLAQRLRAHEAGHGARILQVVGQAGISWDLVRIWPVTTEGHEKALKDLNNRVVLCPRCTPGTRRGVAVTPKARRRPRVRGGRQLEYAAAWAAEEAGGEPWAF